MELKVHIFAAAALEGYLHVSQNVIIFFLKLIFHFATFKNVSKHLKRRPRVRSRSVTQRGPGTPKMTRSTSKKRILIIFVVPAMTMNVKYSK